jgi:6-phosphogluconolactonase
MKLTRRRLLSLLPAATAGAHLALTLPMQAQHGHFFSRKSRVQPSARKPYIYFGTDTSHPSAKGIYRAQFDMASGHISQPELAADQVRSSFMALNHVHGRPFIYVCNEGDEKSSSIVTYSCDLSNGALKELGRVPSGGAGPAYISVDATGRSAYVADYAGGTVATFLVQPDGTLSRPVEVVNMRDRRVFHAPGPQADRQEAAHPHSAIISPDNRFLVINDLGTDSIVTFALNTEDAKLGPPHITSSPHAGAGPRHVAFHPNERWVYGIDELKSTIDQYLWTTTHARAANPEEALLTYTGHTISSVAPDFHGPNTAAEILVAPSGRYLYASNRGEDSLVVFSIEPTDGRLSVLQRISVGGKGPRFFTFDPSGKWIIAGNQFGDSVTVFSCNPGSGRLSGPVQTLAMGGPMFTLFV